MKLLLNNQTGHPSNTKFGYFVAVIVSSAIMLWYAYNLKVTTEMLIFYLVVCGAFSQISKMAVILANFLGAKYGVVSDSVEVQKRDSVGASCSTGACGCGSHQNDVSKGGESGTGTGETK